MNTGVWGAPINIKHEETALQFAGVSFESVSGGRIWPVSVVWQFPASFLSCSPLLWLAAQFCCRPHAAPLVCIVYTRVYWVACQPPAVFYTDQWSTSSLAPHCGSTLKKGAATWRFTEKTQMMLISVSGIRALSKRCVCSCRRCQRGHQVWRQHGRRQRGWRGLWHHPQRQRHVHCQVHSSCCGKTHCQSPVHRQGTHTHVTRLYHRRRCLLRTFIMLSMKDAGGLISWIWIPFTQEVPQSPFNVKVDPSHDALKVKAEGPGLARTGGTHYQYVNSESNNRKFIKKN